MAEDSKRSGEEFGTSALPCPEMGWGRESSLFDIVMEQNTCSCENLQGNPGLDYSIPGISREEEEEEVTLTIHPHKSFCQAVRYDMALAGSGREGTHNMQVTYSRDHGRGKQTSSPSSVIQSVCFL